MPVDQLTSEEGSVADLPVYVDQIGEYEDNQGARTSDDGVIGDVNDEPTQNAIFRFETKNTQGSTVSSGLLFSSSDYDEKAEPFSLRIWNRTDQPVELDTLSNDTIDSTYSPAIIDPGEVCLVVRRENFAWRVVRGARGPDTPPTLTASKVATVSEMGDGIDSMSSTPYGILALEDNFYKDPYLISTDGDVLQSWIYNTGSPGRSERFGYWNGYIWCFQDATTLTRVNPNTGVKESETFTDPTTNVNSEKEYSYVGRDGTMYGVFVESSTTGPTGFLKYDLQQFSAGSSGNAFDIYNEINLSSGSNIENCFLDEKYSQLVVSQGPGLSAVDPSDMTFKYQALDGVEASPLWRWNDIYYGLGDLYLFAFDPLGLGEIDIRRVDHYLESWPIPASDGRLILPPDIFTKDRYRVLERDGSLSDFSFDGSYNFNYDRMVVHRGSIYTANGNDLVELGDDEIIEKERVNLEVGTGNIRF